MEETDMKRSCPSALLLEFQGQVGLGSLSDLTRGSQGKSEKGDGVLWHTGTRNAQRDLVTQVQLQGIAMRFGLKYS